MLYNHPQYCCGCVHWQEVEGDSQNINDNYSLHLLVAMSIPFYINRIRIQFFQMASIAIASIILKLVVTNTSFFIISSKTNLPHLLGLSKQLQLCSQANDLQYQFQQFIIQGIPILQDSNIKEHSSTKSPLNENRLGQNKMGWGNYKPCVSSLIVLHHGTNKQTLWRLSRMPTRPGGT